MFCVLQELIKGTIVSRKIIVQKAFDSLTKHSALPELGRRYVGVCLFFIPFTWRSDSQRHNRPLEGSLRGRRRRGGKREK